MEAVVAVFSDWGIGSDGTQQVVLKADRAHFRDITTGNAVIVGRKTLEDFPGGKPLKNRYNIVVTRQNISIEGATVVHSTEEALKEAEKQERTIIIGGASIYKQFFPFTDIVHITKIESAPHSDSFFPNLDSLPDWKLEDATDWMEENGTRYCFCTYRRIKP